MPSITHIKCDYSKNGKVCGKSVFLHDDPSDNAPNVKDVVRSMDAYGEILYFCCPLHLVCHWTDEIQKRAAAPVVPPQPESLNVAD